MSGVGAIGGNYAMNHYYQSLSSGSRINSAKDGASELAILNKMDSQSRGTDIGTSNIQNGKNALNISDGALGSVTDSLQRMKELALKASNGLMADDDKRAIQGEIDGLKKNITDITSSTNFNGISLLNGKNPSLNIVSDGNGAESGVTTMNSTLDALGIKDFDVTKNFNMKDLDNALDTVSKGRSQNGAEMNGLDYAMNYNRINSYNLTQSKSTLGDTEYGDYTGKLQKEQALEAYKTMMQKKQEEEKANSVNHIFDCRRMWNFIVSRHILSGT